MAAPPLLRCLPLLRLRLHHHHHHNHRVAGGIFASVRRPLCSSASESTRSEEDASSASPAVEILRVLRVMEPSKFSVRVEDSDHRKWIDKEEEILGDIEPITFLVKDILHSDRYMDGERLTPDDERAVVEKLLSFHPHSEDKIGCGLDSIMVDRHPIFKHSRCLFVVRTDGGWIDFSYQKCLREYIRNKYPSHAERFIRDHFKRGSG